MSRTVDGWGADAPGRPVRRTDVVRRDPGPDDVVVRVRWCGVCGTDRHALAHGDPASFPLVPGHEMVGDVLAVGEAVTGLAPGEPVAVGNIVDSCRVCDMCRAGRENWCRDGVTLTYGGVDRVDGRVTQGGFSREYVVDRRFAYPLPPELDGPGTAPLLCAGVTVWAPLRRFDAGPGRRVGVVGLGGLGHVAIRLAHALGARTTAFTTSAAKAAAARGLGADEVVPSTDPDALAAAAGSLDLVVDTVGVPHDVAPYLRALDVDGTLVTVGIPPGDLTIAPLDLVVGARSVAGAGSGGTVETREMLEFCAARGIRADVEVVGPDRLGEALERLGRGDVRYRFVVDVPAGTG